MTTLTINEDIKDLPQRNFNTYQELMEELAELHGYRILWQVDKVNLPEDVKSALEEYEKTPRQELFNI